MKSTLMIIPTDSMCQKRFDSYSAEYPDIDFLSSNLSDLTEEQITEISVDYDIVAGRARFAHFFRDRCPHMHTIEIPITGYDIIDSLALQPLRSAKIAILTSFADIYGMEILKTAFDLTILPYLHVPSAQLPSAIEDACAKGARLILGSSQTCQLARSMDVPAQVIPLGKQSMRQVIGELQNIQQIFQIEDAKNAYIRHLVDAIGEGLISTNDQNQIISMNALAESITGSPHGYYIGRPIAELFPEKLDIGTHIVKIGDQKIMANKVPLITQDKSTLGSAITLYRPDKIQNMESMVRKENLGKNASVKYSFESLIGSSDELQAAIRTGKSYAKTDSNVLIVGETGTGKELFAQSIHHASRRSSQPFIAINCAALPTNLLESELFGYVEGAFTGASKKGKAGVFEAAHGGTLFLDEISEMDYANQGRLLRVLQEKYIVRLGSTKIIPIDVRVIAATNRNLEQLVAEKLFREDLFYRLNVLRFHLPPLRNRGNDPYLLTQCFLKDLDPDSLPYRFEEEAIDFLNSYRWPGNIRQIRNICERIIATCPQHYVSKDYLLETIFPQTARREEERENFQTIREQHKKEELLRALKNNHGKVGAAAQELGINRSTLWRRMKKYEIE